MPGSDEERLVLRALAAMVAFVLAAGIALVVRELDDDSTVEGNTVFGEPRFSGGPFAGTDVPTYVTTRRSALDGLSGRIVATVSFDRYQRESEARSIVRGVEVRALLVAAPGGAPAAVTGGLAAWARAEQAAAEEERENLVRLLATTESAEFAAQYREDVARLDGLLQRLEPDQAVVFGAVVEADAEVLRRLAARGDVRLVDATAVRVDDRELGWVTGLRPEETARAGDPPTRPL